MKIRFCSFLTIALFLLPALQGAERDSLSLLRTIAEYEALPAKWIETVYTNPATRYYQHCTSLTRISLNGVCGKEDEAALLQAGDGYLKGAADVSSWIKLSDRTRLWGNARYTTGKKTGVVWNETADFELLYPYVMADSIGGDLSLQEYAFTGGYSGRAGKFTWGIEGSYRAALEYRNRDPRPKNIVSDLDFAGGGSVRLGKYVVGISVLAQIYSQDNTLDFYAPLGSAYIYTMTGLGTTSVRFGKGDVTDTNYKGYGYGAGIQLLPAQGRKGIYAAANYRKHSVTQHLDGYNNLPLTVLDRTLLDMTAGYSTKQDMHTVGIQVKGALYNRKGTENTFGSAAGNNYDQIGSTTPYTSDQMKIQGELLYGIEAGKNFKGYIRPYYLWFHTDIRQKEKKHRLKTNSSEYGLKIDASGIFEKSLLSLSGNIGIRTGGNGELSIPTVQKDCVREMLEHNFVLSKARRTNYGIALEWSRIFSGWALSVAADWQQSHYEKHGTANYAGVNIGFNF
ncbi:DUF6850 family outer membrane beta-barrel protein [Barnesiella intestinihominis]|uniref:DUF6850 family outer membrane beta-barrel protein n=1 Tax=Barnesiella intestinihominis TaxID=487174 RepID=UPI00307F35C9